MHASGFPRYLPPMNDTLTTFAPHALALLIGGLATSLGITYGARRSGAQRFLARIGGMTLLVTCLVAAAAASVALYALVRPLVDRAISEPASLAPWRLLALGLAVGLPLGLPGLFAAWSEAHRARRAQLKRRDRVPTKDDRRAYAEGLVQQIAEISPTPRALTASISGDGGRVLLFEGEIDAKEGERLTAALRADLQEVGFKRVEGRNGANEWWTRV